MLFRGFALWKRLLGATLYVVARGMSSKGYNCEVAPCFSKRGETPEVVRAVVAAGDGIVFMRSPGSAGASCPDFRLRGKILNVGVE